MNTLKGIPASSGKIKGKVKIILSENDFSKFKPGMILVTRATNPAWTPLIAIAKGVITELGGSLCHAAIVSREFGIPAIVGTKEATKVLKDNQEVEINGEKGLVIF
jgi:pyruvate,water dikinase